MIRVILILILFIVSIYYCFKLRKFDKTKSDNLATIIILTPAVNNLLPIETELKNMILLFMFSLSAVLYKKSYKDIEKKEKLGILEENNLKE